MKRLLVVVLCLTCDLVSGRCATCQVEDAATEAIVLDETDQVTENRQFISNNFSEINRALENDLPKADLNLQETSNASLISDAEEGKRRSSAAEGMTIRTLLEATTNIPQVRDVESSDIIVCAIYVNLSASDEIDNKHQLCGGNWSSLLDNEGVCRPIWCWEVDDIHRFALNHPPTYAEKAENVCLRNLCGGLEEVFEQCEGKMPPIYKVDCRPEIRDYNFSFYHRCEIHHPYTCWAPAVGIVVPPISCRKGMVRDVQGNCRPAG